MTDVPWRQRNARTRTARHPPITGLWSALDAHWVNDPERDFVASRKVVQLKRAAQLGSRSRTRPRS
jgi:hypothetical protein